MKKKPHVFDVLVIGGGIQGLSTAYWLAKNKDLRIGLIDQFQIGHPYGSSHGFSRTTRCAYDQVELVKLMQKMHDDEWPYFEREIGTQLFFPNKGCFFGRGKKFQQYLQAIQGLDVDIEILHPKEARQLFPFFRLTDMDAVLYDKTAGLLAASSALHGLKMLCAKAHVEIMQERKVTHLELEKKPIAIHTDQGNLSAEKVILTAGPWISQLLPDLAHLFTVTRQTVCYLQMKGQNTQWGIGHFPNWSFIGEGDNNFYYGLPEFGRKGIKVAQHITQGNRCHADEKILEADPQQVDAVSKFVKREFTAEIQGVIDSETCLYTNTLDERFIVDFYPHDSRVTIGSVCSGHGFKFAPLIGRALAELSATGSSWPEFEMTRKKLFAFP